MQRNATWWPAALPAPPERVPAEAAGDAGGLPTQHEHVYQTLRQALIAGRFAPGRGVSLRGLAEMLDVGIMPARDALRRLSAERALEVRANRRVYVPSMTPAFFDELMRARLLLEAECAERALPSIDAARLHRLRAFDAALESSYATGNVELYMVSNYHFHFEMYRAVRSDVLVPLLEGMWVRFGPFMRVVYELSGTADLVDKHAQALHAIERRDATALRAAIEADVRDGMALLGRGMFARADGPRVRGRMPGAA